jgi:acyl carrier protein
MHTANTLTAPAPSAERIQEWLVNYLAKHLGIEDASTLNVTTQFDRYGLSSVAAVGMAGELEDWLGISIDPTLSYDFPTIEALAGHLAEKLVSS